MNGAHEYRGLFGVLITVQAEVLILLMKFADRRALHLISRREILMEVNQ